MNKFILFCWLSLILTGCSVSGKYTDIGEQYLGAKYIESPLGEEQEPDTDPLIRTDGFDCTTFVETALANGNIDKLTHIRYKDGEIGFLTRNHFIETDWLQNNSNIVENISSLYGQTSIRTVTINKRHWFKKVHNIETDIKPITINLEYIPYSNLHIPDNKDALIVLFISGNPDFYDKIGTDLAVVHMGFLLPNGVLRHASSKQGKVVDVDIKSYIENLKKNKNNLGVSLVKIK